MNLEGITVVHAIPGRIRLKIASLRDNATLASELQHRLVAIPGVQQVETNPRTSSVLILYDVAATASPEALLTLAAPLAQLFPGVDLNDLQALGSPTNGSHPTLSLAQGVAGFFGSLNQKIDTATSGVVDLKILLPLGLFLLGIRSLVSSEKRVIPTWYDFFWFALGTYFMMYPKPGEKTPP
jgi:Heavy metal associated domain 2